MVEKHRGPIHMRALSAGAAAAFAAILAGCVSTQNSGESGTVAIALSRNVQSCTDEHGITCVELAITNRSGAPVEFALSTIDDLVVSYGGTTADCAQGSRPEVTDIGSFQAPFRFLAVRRGRSSRLIVPVPDIPRGSADVVCVVIEDTQGTEYRVPIRSGNP